MWAWWFRCSGHQATNSPRVSQRRYRWKSRARLRRNSCVNVRLNWQVGRCNKSKPRLPFTVLALSPDGWISRGFDSPRAINRALAASAGYSPKLQPPRRLANSPAVSCSIRLDTLRGHIFTTPKIPNNKNNSRKLLLQPPKKQHYIIAALIYYNFFPFRWLHAFQKLFNVAISALFLCITLRRDG